MTLLESKTSSSIEVSLFKNINMLWVSCSSHENQAERKDKKNKDKWKTQKSTDLLTFSGWKIAKNEHVSVFCNFFAKKMPRNSWFFCFR